MSDLSCTRQHLERSQSLDLALRNARHRCHKKVLKLKIYEVFPLCPSLTWFLCVAISQTYEDSQKLNSINQVDQICALMELFHWRWIWLPNLVYELNFHIVIVGYFGPIGHVRLFLSEKTYRERIFLSVSLVLFRSQFLQHRLFSCSYFLVWTLCYDLCSINHISRLSNRLHFSF